MKKGYKQIKLDLTDEEFGKLARLAHNANMTFNDYCNKRLAEYIDELKKLDKIKKKPLKKTTK